MNDSCKQIDADLAAWRALNASTNSPASGAAASVTLNSINSQLVTQNLAPLPIAIGISTAPFAANDQWHRLLACGFHISNGTIRSSTRRVSSLISENKKS